MRATRFSTILSRPRSQTQPKSLLLLALLALSSVNIDGHAVSIQSARETATTGGANIALPDGRALVERAMKAMGASSNAPDEFVASFASVSSLDTPMGTMRVDYNYLAATAEQPAACRVVQSNTGVNATFEIGTANGIAWIGDSGRYKAADPRMTNELLGGSDLQLLLRSLLSRFENFTTIGTEESDGKRVWVVSMQPKAAIGAPQPNAAWTLRLDAQSGLPTSFDTPMATPPSATTNPATNSAAPSVQRTELSDWKPIELGTKAPTKDVEALRAQAPVAFRQAVRTVSGMKITMRYEKVAMNTLEPGSIEVPNLSAQPADAKTR